MTLKKITLKKWRESLKDFRKGSGTLCRFEDGHYEYCCMGVLEVLAGAKKDALLDLVEDGVKAAHYPRASTLNLLNLNSRFLKISTSGKLAANDVILPEDVIAALKKEFPHLYESNIYRLTELNDECETWKPIEMALELLEAYVESD